MDVQDKSRRRMVRFVATPSAMIFNSGTSTLRNVSAREGPLCCKRARKSSASAMPRSALFGYPRACGSKGGSWANSWLEVRQIDTRLPQAGTPATDCSSQLGSPHMQCTCSGLALAAVHSGPAFSSPACATHMSRPRRCWWPTIRSPAIVILARNINI